MATPAALFFAGFFFVSAGNNDNHNISDEFEFRQLGPQTVVR